MKSARKPALLILIFMINYSCNSLNDKIILPDSVLNIPKYDNETDDIFSTTAVDINNNNETIGWTTGNNFPLLRYYESPSRGFWIDSEEKVTRIGNDSLYCTWPLAINNAETIVGAYLPVRERTDNIESEYIQPCYAFTYSLDSKEIIPIHNFDFYFTVASEINDDGIIGGYCGKKEKFGNVSQACIFNHPDSGFVILHNPIAYTSLVVALNNNYCIVKSEFEGGEYLLVNFEIYEVSSLKRIGSIPIPDIELFLANTESINAKNEVVGWILPASNALCQGFVYDIDNSNFKIFKADKKINNDHYVEFRFMDINDNSRIAGIAGRVNGQFGLPQARAAILEPDFSNLKDITPPNKDTYGEAYAINNDGRVVGYAGFMQARALVINRAFSVNP